MNEGAFPGEIRINEVVETRLVRAYFTGSSILLGDGARKTYCDKRLTLTPFSVQCLREPLPMDALGSITHGLRPRQWQFTGTSLGEYRWGPYNHPADGEFDIRTVTSFDANVAYARDGIAVWFAGETATGFSVCYFANTLEARGLAPWRFDVRFRVPRDQLRAFLEFSDEQAYAKFCEMLDMLPAGS